MPHGCRNSEVGGARLEAAHKEPQKSSLTRRRSLTSVVAAEAARDQLAD